MDSRLRYSSTWSKNTKTKNKGQKQKDETMHTLRHILYLMLAILMAGCTDIDHLSSTDTEEQGDRINLGGVETDILAVASDATRGSTATRAG